MQETERDEQLELAWERAESYSGDTSVLSLQRLCRSDDPDTRILGLLLIRAQIESGKLLSEYFDIARQLIEDQNNHCRWQSIIVIEEFIPSDTDAVWEIISHYGKSDDEDMRVAIAVNLLETLFEHDFDTYFPRLRILLQSGSVNYQDTLSNCWPPAFTEKQWREIRKLLAEVSDNYEPYDPSDPYAWPPDKFREPNR